MDTIGKFSILKVFKRTYKYSLYEKLSKLAHINMPIIHRIGLMDDCFYVIEEYIEGRTLQEILETDGAFNAKSTIDIISQLCDVLMYLHNQIPSLIHRDITPSNVILSSEGIIKLLDFDIAREHKETVSKDTEVFGTKPFAPPEQYGFAQSDNRTDIYSLGILMTSMLTNTYDPNRIKSFRLRMVVKRCTAFDPKKRFQDARNLKNSIILCAPPRSVLFSLTHIDTYIYVFPNSQLRIGRLILPILAIYFAIIAFAFIQPYPLDGHIPSTSLLFFTIVINPQWIASNAQYQIFYILAYAMLTTLYAFISFAVYDIAWFYYLKAKQKFHLKRNTLMDFGIIPFVIASQRYVFCSLSIISTLVIICSIPFTDIWTEYNIHGFAIFVTLLCYIFSFVIRNTSCPKYYNKAVRCYYKGNMKEAAIFAKKSIASKRNHARAWLIGFTK
jgi:hypothetical protein